LNKYILNTVNQVYINNNLNSDIAKLLFQNPKFDHVSVKEIIEQIEAKKKCKTKLPTWFESQNIYFPNKLSIEQTSSEITAKYKSQLVSGTSLIDLTGGFGVDAYYFSKRIKSVTHCEINEELSQIVKHNNHALKVKNMVTVSGDGLIFLDRLKEKKYDWIYADPSRRHDTKGKVFFLKDCLPNIPQHLDRLFTQANNIMIKTAPLLDIKAGLKELRAVKEIHVIAIDNDVKELLWILEKGYASAVTIKTINLKKHGDDVFSFLMRDEQATKATFSEPSAYLYEPNSAILKAGAFKLISQKLNINKLHTNTHLYTTNDIVEFPGRRFKIEKALPYNKKLLKKEFVYRKANMSIRNFPESVEQLKKKFNLNDGGTTYVFFTTDMNNQKIVLICSKV